MAGYLSVVRMERTRTFGLPLAILLAALGLFMSSAGDIRGAEETMALPATNQYGTPGPGKILIFVKGQVAHPGRYYVERGPTLADVLKLVGNLLACPDCKSLPTIVTVYSGENPKNGKDYQLADVQALRTVTLGDGDHVSFWHFRL